MVIGGGATVKETLLDPLRLAAYVGHFASEGYEFVVDLLHADSQDIEELVSGASMKKPEAKHFYKALLQLSEEQ
eukprot:COSAG05_NODE_12_length_37297_cov_117.537072_18_plen_74_part_00